MGLYAALRTSVIPVFFVFPVAFTLNRLGQHYDIDPDDPAKWGTLMKGHWFWDFAFLNSNYHLEHHYFPGVPFYHLPALQRGAHPVLRTEAHAMAELRQARIRMADREPRPSHRLDSAHRGDWGRGTWDWTPDSGLGIRDWGSYRTHKLDGGIATDGLGRVTGCR